MTQALGIDIGGTGIKGAIVDTDTGKLVSDRMKIATPKSGKPDAIVAVVVELIEKLGGIPESMPVGVCFPAIVRNGKTMSAANISKEWIGLEAEALFEKALGRDIRFVNDADAAGVAEVRYGAAQGVPGLILLTTLGTGIGSALIYNGTLVPNSELGHLTIGRQDAEKGASFSAKERRRLSWKAWAKRLQRYYTHLELLFSPDLFLVGGGVSKSHEKFLPLLKLKTPIVPAKLRNNAGILGAAALAVKE
ncbi:ROK family protein [Salinibacterium sp. NSLL150]|uniref:polyphosphate--glucose phosphotransferase n=1 Tax=unclassified Salinibacterium TaxID=2632331 RepID=UPI0018CD95E5|nr:MULTISPECIES: ROK family protein [unclassified Salinibacterium]MBH0098990.1 ROK family protein [Salinibacterium sp. NSLL35]MBH0101744.1 ROK family protein [Salinibacterium sp. NSLL150]MBH0104504.1 ROK family protein [Salinibacterium sp. NSLL16]MBH0107264.1 ROK family protein [Salinibacterium sp. NSLL17]